MNNVLIAETGENVKLYDDGELYQLLRLPTFTSVKSLLMSAP